MVTESGVRARKTKPKLRAAETSAPSSGDWAWYSSLPISTSKHKSTYNLHRKYSLQCPQQSSCFTILNFFDFFPDFFTAFLFGHDRVAEGQQTEELVAGDVLVLDGLHQHLVVEFETLFVVRIEREINRFRILLKKKKIWFFKCSNFVLFCVFIVKIYQNFCFSIVKCHNLSTFWFFKFNFVQILFYLVFIVIICQNFCFWSVKCHNWSTFWFFKFKFVQILFYFVFL